MDSSNTLLLSILKERVESLLDSGNYEEALHTASAAVEATAQKISPDLDSTDAYTSALELRGNIYRDLSDYENAINDFLCALELMDNRPDQHAFVGRLHAELGTCYVLMEDIEKTAHHWQAAIQFFEAADPPLWIDIATLSNNLGFLHKSDDHIEAAENCFLRALEILRSEHGPETEETASIFCSLGGLYEQAGRLEQAREMHMLGLEIRTKLLGDQHPDTAQSHNNLALLLLQTDDRSLARGHLEKALVAYEMHATEFAEDLEAVAHNYCELLLDEGEAELAETTVTRIHGLLGYLPEPA